MHLNSSNKKHPEANTSLFAGWNLGTGEGSAYYYGSLRFSHKLQKFELIRATGSRALNANAIIFQKWPLKFVYKWKTFQRSHMSHGNFW